MNRREFFSTIGAAVAGAVGAAFVRRTPPCEPAAIKFSDGAEYKWEIIDSTGSVTSDEFREEITRVLVDSLEAM